MRALTLATILPVVAMAQPANHATARTASGFSADRLARIDSMLQHLIDEKKIPGAVVLLMRDGRVAYQKAVGYRDIDTRAPLRTDDIFRIASQTKAVTSLAVMMLWEEGRFGLDDPIGRYLPAFEKQTVLKKFNPSDSSFEAEPTRRRITIRQLLTHTSGIDYPSIGSEEFRAIYAKAGIPAGVGNNGDVLADKMDLLGQMPLKHQPGEKFTYGLSIDVLGRLVEVISGMPLDQFFRTRIFEPLRMNDTWFYLPADRRARLVTMHSDSAGRVWPMHERADGGVNPDWPTKPGHYFSGGAGLSSSIGDYARFLQMFLNGGELDGVRLLSRKTVELMLTNQIPNLHFPFGLGFALETEENDAGSPLTVGSFSWGGAFSTTYWADPKERLIGLLYLNVFGSSQDNLADRFKTLVYSALQ